MNKPILRSLLGIFLIGIVSGSIKSQELANYVTSDGHDFGVRVQPEKKTLMLGETTFLLFEVKNLSNKTLSFGDGGDYRNRLGRPESYKVTVVREDGTPVPQPEIDFSMGGLIGSQTVPIDGSYVRKLFLPHWATFSGPGMYFITVTRTISIGERANTTQATKDRLPIKPVTTSARTRIDIIETDDLALGKVIDDLGAALLKKSDRSDGRYTLQMLNAIHDERTIKYWVRAMEVYSTASGWETTDRFRGLPSIIAKYDTPESFAALAAGMKSKNEDVRLDVADALRISKNPEAMPLLLGMQNDPYWFVRLRVVQALGQLKTDESTNMLIRMLDDEKDSVWKSAEQYLKARNKMPENRQLRPMEKLECPIRQTHAVKSMQGRSGSGGNESGESSVFSTYNCEKALNAFLEELRIARESDERFREAWVLRQIGDIYNESRRYKEALEYYEMALPLFQQLKNDAQRSLLFELGGISEILKDYKKSLDYMNQELMLARSSEEKSTRNDEWRILDRIATVHFKMGDDANGFKYLLEVLNFERNQEDHYGERQALIALGRAYEKRGRKLEALESYQKALKVLVEDRSSWVKDVLEKEDQELREAIARLK